MQNTAADAGPAGAPGQLLTLEQLEADIAAVGSAMETVDRIVAEVGTGERPVGSAAAEIEAVVSADRFGVADSPSAGMADSPSAGTADPPFAG